MPPVTFNEVIPGVHYGCHPDHRNGNHNKSQWIISTSEEVESFMGGFGARSSIDASRHLSGLWTAGN